MQSGSVWLKLMIYVSMRSTNTLVTMSSFISSSTALIALCSHNYWFEVYIFVFDMYLFTCVNRHTFCHLRSSPCGENTEVGVCNSFAVANTSTTLAYMWSFSMLLLWRYCSIVSESFRTPVNTSGFSLVMHSRNTDTCVLFLITRDDMTDLLKEQLHRLAYIWVLLGYGMVTARGCRKWILQFCVLVSNSVD